MTSKKPTDWGAAADAELAPIMRVVDFVLIYAALWLPTYARGEAWDQKSWTAATIAAVLFMVIGQSLRLYQSARGMRLKPQLVRIWAAWFVGVVPVLLFLLFLSKRSEDYSRVTVSTWFVLAPLLVVVWRTATTLTLRELRAHGYNTRAAAIIGMTELGERLALQIKAVPSLGLEVHGFYDDRSEERCHPIAEALGQRAGDLADVVNAARAGEIDLIYIAFPLRAEPRIAELLRQLSDTTASVYLAADFFAYDLLHARWGTLGGVPTVSLHETPFYGVDGWLKRLEDVVVGTLILITISVPMLVIGILREAHFSGSRSVQAAAIRPKRRGDPRAEVPLDDGHRGRPRDQTSHCGGRPDHQARGVSAADEPGRAAAVLQRSRGEHEHRRSPAARGRAQRALPEEDPRLYASAQGQARHHGLGPGQRLAGRDRHAG